MAECLPGALQTSHKHTEHVSMTFASQTYFFWSTDPRNEQHCNTIKIRICPICPGQEEKKKEKEI